MQKVGTTQEQEVPANTEDHHGQPIMNKIRIDRADEQAQRQGRNTSPHHTFVTEPALQPGKHERRQIHRRNVGLQHPLGRLHIMTGMFVHTDRTGSHHEAHHTVADRRGSDGQDNYRRAHDLQQRATLNSLPTAVCPRLVIETDQNNSQQIDSCQ